MDQLYQSLTLKYLNAVASFRIRRIFCLDTTTLSPGKGKGWRTSCKLGYKLQLNSANSSRAGHFILSRKSKDRRLAYKLTSTTVLPAVLRCKRPMQIEKNTYIFTILSLTRNVRGNGRNSVGQQLPTLFDVTFCVRLHILLHVVRTCCAKFETGQSFSYA